MAGIIQQPAPGLTRVTKYDSLANLTYGRIFCLARPAPGQAQKCGGRCRFERWAGKLTINDCRFSDFQLRYSIPEVRVSSCGFGRRKIAGPARVQGISFEKRSEHLVENTGPG
jgi:hypothetical protein